MFLVSWSALCGSTEKSFGERFASTVNMVFPGRNPYHLAFREGIRRILGIGSTTGNSRTAHPAAGSHRRVVTMGSEAVAPIDQVRLFTDGGM